MISLKTRDDSCRNGRDYSHIELHKGFTITLLFVKCKLNKGFKIQFLRQLTTLTSADEIVARITDTATHNLSYYGYVLPPMSDSGTSHLSLVGPEGDALSITSTINTP